MRAGAVEDLDAVCEEFVFDLPADAAADEQLDTELEQAAYQVGFVLEAERNRLAV